ncbi:hypothetical protein [Sulfurovum mangrovi]|uniref:hypothetical protein n=1 Tax=Sulfurovum mangrovi TaxID=2893889 RepID=UPI001E3EB76F|nr:hypothetical protein [Sulfurovum mangrovi]UFH59669.1 hypothetical protein LN246_02170 [Sulfurovum mangrovi]UFH60814.1 hypothetical protein LN246_14790 [Sulfurovum mangrovi]
MKKTMVATMGLFLATFTFTGCGGSAGTDSSQETVSGNENNEPAPQVEENALHNISYIEGVYDITSEDDVIYLAIDTEGVVNTYDYQADFSDNGMDCYIKNSPLKEVNKKINGKTLQEDQENNYFYLDDIQISENQTNELRWVYGEMEEIEYVSLDGSITAGGRLYLNDIRIATSKYLVTDVTLEEMELNICK